MKKALCIILSGVLGTILCLITHDSSALAGEVSEAVKFRSWIDEMKQRDRGPFTRLRWFCKDGSILAPQPYACSDHGGGVQHGEWSKRTKTMRQKGYFIATLLADKDKALMKGPEQADPLRQLLIEKYLMSVDDGWIMRKARYYRGAFQSEDEIRGARDILLQLVRSEDWLKRGYRTLFMAVQILPHGIDTPSVLKMRQMAADLSADDKGFMRLRNKIHSAPDASDAMAVREYAAGLPEDKAKKFLRLADLIDEIYARPPLNLPISRLSKRVRKMPNMSRSLRDMSARLISTNDPEILFETIANTMMVLRDQLANVPKAGIRLDVLDTSVLLEAEHFDLGRELMKHLDQATRSQRLQWLRSNLKATYGTGLLSRRQLDAMLKALDKLDVEEISLKEYRRQINYLSRVPGWADTNLRTEFEYSWKKMVEIEPLAELFIQDQLRGSPLLFHVEVLDSLIRDANHLAGIRSEIFGEELAGGLRSLNPGIARGTLYLLQGGQVSKFDPQGIYLLSETVASLPPVAGIITKGEGNPLSHVQLLARNLGIPNVSIDETLIKKLKPYKNKKVILAVSHDGVVRLFEDDSRYDYLFNKKSEETEVIIEPDLEKLDLDDLTFRTLDDLRATDSGVTVGPKAAKLGELRHHFPDSVANGIVIPFGSFRQLLQQPMPGAGKSVFYWMVDQYESMASLPEDSPKRKKAEQFFRKKLTKWINNANPGKSFKLRLKKQMNKVFGKDGSYGVFVRSDTNVEDLPNFTGAGLNLTVPNVVGYMNILRAIAKVWSSPFSKRAFDWRQSHMKHPEHVYPAVLLMQSVPVEKSGVLVTRDIDTGEQGWLSIAVNEGVGGAVDGQAAETIKVDARTGEVILMAQASAKTKKILAKSGGIREVPVSGRDTILFPGEIKQLIELAAHIPEKFPGMVDEEGNPLPADIEFGFLKGKLQLFQIRPFLESKRARSNEYLIEMDKAVSHTDNVQVELNKVP